MTTKYDHEDAALQALCDELIARGSSAEITAYPDRDPSHPLTVDAIISINGTKWAVDHCLLSRSPLLPPALKVAKEALQRRLDATAQVYGCMICVSYCPQIGAKGERWGTAYYDRIVALAEEAAATKTARVMIVNDFATVQTIQSETPVAVLVAFTNTTGHPGTGTQVHAGLREPLLKKLCGQFKQAKEAGLPTALLLDQVPRPGGKSYTVWIAGPNTVAAVVAAILRDHDGKNSKVLDQVWLRPASPTSPLDIPSLHLLIGGDQW